MNLTLTPLNEAYNIPKQKPKAKINMYTEESTQKKMLENAAHQTNNHIPEGYTVNDYATQDSVIPKTVSTPAGITLRITDPELMDLLSIYNENYIPQLLKKCLLQNNVEVVPQKIEKIEKFTDFNFLDQNVLMYILIFLLVGDILIRFKY